MKKFSSYFILFSLLFSPLASYAQEDEDTVYYTDEDDDLFNRGKFVGEESNAYILAQKRERNRNWMIAIGTTAIGVAALVLTSNHHQHSKR